MPEEGIKRLLNLLLPPRYCFLCHYLISHEDKSSNQYLCSSCLGEVNNLLIFPGWESSLNTNKFYSLYKYEKEIKDLIVEYKYLKNDFAGSVLKSLAADFFCNNWNWIKIDLEAIIPIPTHRLKRSSRGFNQVSSLLSHCSKELQKCISYNVLSKPGYSKAQSTLGAEERKTNVIGSFKLNKEIFGNVLIFDDVQTTKSTIREAKKTLEVGGARTFSLSFAEKR